MSYAGRRLFRYTIFWGRGKGKSEKQYRLKICFRSTDINEIKQTLEFFGIDKDDENNQKRFVIWRTDNAYCRTYTGVSVWYRYTQFLKNCYTPLIPDRPYREMRWSDERKDKRCVHKKEDTSTFSKWLCSWWHFPLSCFHFWGR